MPTKPQVIRFSGNLIDGSIGETLRGGPVDLSKMGAISVRRSSEIKFNEDKQRYYIEFLEPKLLHMNKEMAEYLFTTYEFAVDHEVITLNRLRKQGVF